MKMDPAVLHPARPEVILDVVEQAEKVLEGISRSDLHGEVGDRLRRLAISIFCLLQESTPSPELTPSMPPRSPDRAPPVKRPGASTRCPLSPAKSTFAQVAAKPQPSPQTQPTESRTSVMCKSIKQGARRGRAGSKQRGDVSPQVAHTPSVCHEYIRHPHL